MRAQKTSKHLDIINRCHGDGLRLSQARARQFISVRALILCMHAVFVCARTCLCDANRKKKNKKILPTARTVSPSRGQRVRLVGVGLS